MKIQRLNIFFVIFFAAVIAVLFAGASFVDAVVYNCARCSTQYSYTYATFKSHSSDCSNPYEVDYSQDCSCGPKASDPYNYTPSCVPMYNCGRCSNIESYAYATFQSTNSSCTDSYGTNYFPDCSCGPKSSDSFGYTAYCACSDSDGQDFYSGGTVNYSGNSYDDSCLNSTRINEYFCQGNPAYANSVEYDCPYGCDSASRSCRPMPAATASVSVSPNPVPYGGNPGFTLSSTNAYYCYILIDWSTYILAGYATAGTYYYGSFTLPGNHTASTYCYNANWVDSSWSTTNFTVEQPCVINLSVSPSGAGTAAITSGSAAHACGTGETPAATATANSGYTFVGWDTDSNGSVDYPSNNNPLNISNSTNWNITARFVQNCSLDGASVAHGESITAYDSGTYNCGASPNGGAPCPSITRTCNNGVLSGSSSYNKRFCHVSRCSTTFNYVHATFDSSNPSNCYDPNGVLSDTVLYGCDSSCGVASQNQRWENDQCGPSPFYRVSRCSTVYNYAYATFSSSSNDPYDTAAYNFAASYSCVPPSTCGLASGNQTVNDSSTGWPCALPPTPSNLSASCNFEGTQATLNWTPTNYTTKYQLRVDNTTNNASTCTDGWFCSDPPDKIVNDYAAASYTMAVVPDEPYSWWVHSSNLIGNSASAIASFTCNSPVPVVDVKINGADNSSVNAPADLTVSWTVSNKDWVSGSQCVGTGLGFDDGNLSKNGGSKSGGALNKIPSKSSNYVLSYSVACPRTWRYGGTSSDTATVTINSQPPTAVSLTVTQPNYTTSNFGPAGIFTWAFSDPGDSQSAYQIQVDDNSDFSSLAWDSGKVNSNSISGATPSGVFAYNKTYYWRLMVWDSAGVASSWAVAPSSFTTPKHKYPLVDFSWLPNPPLANEQVQFFDKSKCYGIGNVEVPCPLSNAWFWVVPDADFVASKGSSNASKNPWVKFNSSGPKSVNLTVTDADGYSKMETLIIDAQRAILSLPLPGWKEVAP